MSLKDAVTPVRHQDKKRIAEFSPPSPDFKDDLLQKLSSLIDEKMSTFGESQIREIQKSFSSNMDKKIEKMSKDMKRKKDEILTGVKLIVSEYDIQLCKQEKKLENLSKKVGIEQEKRINVEAELRRSNLKIFGVPNNVGDITAYITPIFASAIPNFVDENVETAYRLRQKLPGKNPAPVIVKFSSYSLRQKVWKKRFEINKDSTLFMSEDIPLEWQQRRRVMAPIVSKVKQMKTYNGSDIDAFIIRDKLVYNKRWYDIDNLNLLPLPFRPETVFTPMKKDKVLFFSKYSPFSNHHLSRFSVDNITYNCSEQYIMRKKCLLFNDTDQAEEVMIEESPVLQKSLGSKIKNFDKKLWEEKAEKLVTDGIRAKVYQNPYIKKLLVETGDRKIGEANGKDNLFAIGCYMNDKNAWDSQWKGQNIMGKVLEHIRAELLPDIEAKIDSDDDSSVSALDQTVIENK